MGGRVVDWIKDNEGQVYIPHPPSGSPLPTIYMSYTALFLPCSAFWKGVPTNWEGSELESLFLSCILTTSSGQLLSITELLKISTCLTPCQMFLTIGSEHERWEGFLFFKGRGLLKKYFYLLFGCARSYLWQAGSLVTARELWVAACEI